MRSRGFGERGTNRIWLKLGAEKSGEIPPVMVATYCFMRH